MSRQFCTSTSVPVQSSSCEPGEGTIFSFSAANLSAVWPEHRLGRVRNHHHWLNPSFNEMELPPASLLACPCFPSHIKMHLEENSNICKHLWQLKLFVFAKTKLNKSSVFVPLLTDNFCFTTVSSGATLMITWEKQAEQSKREINIYKNNGAAPGLIQVPEELRFPACA